MANMIKNIVYFSSPRAEEIATLASFMETKLQPFDFNQLIPVPAQLLACSGTMDKDRKRTNQKRFGFADWYDFRMAKWGCKGNASFAEWESPTKLSFITPGNAPVKIFQALAEKFPGIDFTVEYADEDLTSGNCGMIEAENGSVSSYNDLQYWFEFACDVWGCAPTEVNYEIEEAYA